MYQHVDIWDKKVSHLMDYFNINVEPLNGFCSQQVLNLH